MTKGLFFLVVSLFFSMSVHSQNILTDVSKYDLDKIEHLTVKKSRKLLKTSKGRDLSVFTYFAIGLSDYFFEKPNTIDDFFNKIKLYDKYRCYVYDDSLNIIAMAIETNVFPYVSTTPDNLYIKYITRINPKYIFEYLFSPTSYPMYFCYKDGGIIIVHLSDDGKNIVSYPLSELKDWKWLNTGKLDKTIILPKN